MLLITHISICAVMEKSCPIAQPPIFINNILDFACSLLIIDCDTSVCVYVCVGGSYGVWRCGGCVCVCFSHFAHMAQNDCLRQSYGYQNSPKNNENKTFIDYREIFAK